MYTLEKVYRSLIYHIGQIVPSGVTVTEGESYGVMVEDPTMQIPSVAVIIDDLNETDIELGSFSSSYGFTLSIAGRSRLQRDALKSILFDALRKTKNQITVYSDFIDYTPAPTAVAESAAEVGTLIVSDVPNFSTDRERFFWVSVVVSALTIIQ